MSKSTLKKITALPRCGGLLSRLAYELGRSRGIDVGKLLRQARLTPSAIKNEHIQLAVPSQIKFVDLVAKAIGDSLFGLHVGYSYDLREIGLFYYVIASADTLLESLLRAARYTAVANDGIDLKIKEENKLRVRLSYSGVARHTDVHQIEFWIASLIRICRKLTDRNLKPLQIRIRHDRTGKTAEIEKLIDGKVEAGADVDEIVFPKDSAEYPIVSADTYLNRLCAQFCEETLARLGRRSDLPLKVRVENAIGTLLPHRKVDIAAVAEQLGIGSRTLARRLASDDHSFSEIFNGLRFALANRYLTESALQISEIAWLLGYSEVASFTHAFQRWSGTNPQTARVKKCRLNTHGNVRF
jgi:AraC-like DNA-binding protein